MVFQHEVAGAPQQQVLLLAQIHVLLRLFAKTHLHYFQGHWYFGRHCWLFRLAYVQLQVLAHSLQFLAVCAQLLLLVWVFWGWGLSCSRRFGLHIGFVAAAGGVAILFDPWGLVLPTAFHELFPFGFSRSGGRVQLQLLFLLVDHVLLLLIIHILPLNEILIGILNLLLEIFLLLVGIHLPLDVLILYISDGFL